MFTWKPMYAEIVEKLSEYESHTRRLAELIIRLSEEGLKVSAITDEDPQGTSIALDEVDPFTFLAIFNRGVTDANRIAVLRAIKEDWELSSALPEDFDGLPVVNMQNSWFMPYKYKRGRDHVPTLWRLFNHISTIKQESDLDTALFDECLGLQQVGAAKLTMGMFWCQPDVWLSVDKKNLARAAASGINLTVKSGADYVTWLKRVKETSSAPLVEFSFEAHLEFIGGGTRAKADHDSEVEDETDEDVEREYWVLAPGQGAALWDNWYEEGIGSIGWHDMGDLHEYESKDSIADAMPEHYPDAGPASVSRMLWEFAHVMKPGDVVFAKLGLHKVCGWGVVAGEYAYDENEDPFHNTRPIEWRDATEVSMPTGLQLPLKTLTRMTSKQKFLDVMAAAYEEVPGLRKRGHAVDARTGVAPKATNDDSRIAGAAYELSDAMADLFMPEEQVSLCIDLLRRKKNLILQGAPGTGKTFVAKRLAYLLMKRKDNSRIQMVQFHQSMTYEDFVQGFKPTSDGNFKLDDGIFHKFVKSAMANPDVPFVFIIDEINRGNLSKVFGELMMLIEPDKRSPDFAMPLSYSSDPEATFYVPPNVHLIGTMNTADRSLSMVDYALRRRFAFVGLEPCFRSEVFALHLKRAGAADEIVTEIRTRMKSINEAIVTDESNLGRGYQIGHSFFVPAEGQTADAKWLQQVLRYEIAPLIEEYYCDDPAQRSAVMQHVQDSD